MATATTPQTERSERELVIRRLFQAPRNLVFHVWTQPEHVAKWWGPTGFTNTVQEMEVKPGGTWRFVMHGPDGKDYPNKIVYQEVVEPEKLVFFHGSDVENDPEQFIVTVTFEQEGTQTAVTMRMLFPTKEQLDKVVQEYGAIEGNKQTMDRLEQHLVEVSKDTSDREIVSTRVFNAKRSLVYHAWTNAAHLANWWGPNGFKNTIHKFELAPGGIWEFTMHGPNRVDYPNTNIFIEIVNQERIVLDHVSSHLFRIVVTFEDLGSQTKVVFRMIHASKEESEKVKHYVVPANEENFDRLEAELARIATVPFVIERSYKASASKLWKALTSKEEMKKLYFDLAEFKPEVGFQFQFSGKGRDGQEYVHLCEVTQVVEERKLAHSWTYKGLEGYSEVIWELFPEKDGTKLRLTHNGLDTFRTSNPDFAKASFAEGWAYIVGESLKNHLVEAHR